MVGFLYRTNWQRALKLQKYVLLLLLLSKVNIISFIITCNALGQSPRDDHTSGELSENISTSILFKYHYDLSLLKQCIDIQSFFIRIIHTFDYRYEMHIFSIFVEINVFAKNLISYYLIKWQNVFYKKHKRSFVNTLFECRCIAIQIKRQIKFSICHFLLFLIVSPIHLLKTKNVLKTFVLLLFVYYDIEY